VSTLALFDAIDRPSILGPDPGGRDTPSRTEPSLAVGGRSTLDDVITSAWEDLAAHRTTDCPLCGGVLQPRYAAAGAAPLGGRCTSCGTTLA